MMVLIINKVEGTDHVASIVFQESWLFFLQSADRMSPFLYGFLEPNFQTRDLPAQAILYFLYPCGLAYQVTRKISVSVSDSYLIMDLILSHLRLFSEGIFAMD